jgi:hypothetical protein
MRLSSSDLHRLVRSFSANEKMLFKRFNKQSGKNAAFMLLFDALAAMEDYDGVKLMHSLKKKGVNSYLKSLKTYLYDQLMVYLRANPGIKTRRWQMRQLNIDGDLLLERGLRHNALELYKEQLKLAKAVSNPHHELTALDNFILYASKTIDVPLLQQYENELTQKIGAFHNLMLVQTEYRKVNAFYASNFPIRDKKVIAQLNMISRAGIMRRQQNMLSPLAHIFYFNFHTYISLLKYDYESAYRFALKRNEYYATTLQEVEGTYLLRISGLELLIKAAAKSNRVDEALVYYKQLAAICNGRDDLRTLLTKYNCFAFLNGYTDWKEATEKERIAALAFFEANGASTAAANSGMMSLAYAFFRHKKYNHTLTLLNHIITEKYTFLEAVLQTEARLLAIITHYELKNYRLISYMVTNTRRFLKQQQKLYPLENAILNGLIHLPEKINAADMQRSLLKLRNNLQTIFKNPLDYNALTGFDFVAWIDGELRKKNTAIH